MKATNKINPWKKKDFASKTHERGSAYRDSECKHKETRCKMSPGIGFT